MPAKIPLNKGKPPIRKSAQEIQDEIFRKMSVEKKIEFGSQLWQFAKDLIGAEEYIRRIRLWNK